MSGLIPFEKGVSGNPKGKPKGSLNSKTIITKLLEIDVDAKSLTDEAVKVTAHEAIWLKTLKQAMEGDEKARRDIYDRLEGKPLQKVETETKRRCRIHI